MNAERITAHERSLLDSLLEGCQVIDRDWKYIYFNDAAIGHAQQPREALIGKKMWDAYPGINETEMFAKLELVMKERKAERILNQFTYPDGGTGWFELHVQPVPDGILILSQDVTEKHLATEQSDQQIKRLNTLRQIDLAITSGVDLSVVANAVLGHAIRGLGVDAGTILLRQEDSLKMSVAAFHGFNGNHPSEPIKIGDGLAGQAVRQQNIIIAENLDEEPRFLRKDMVTREGFVCYFGAPLISQGKVLGVLEVFHRSPKQNDSAWLEFFEIVAGQVAIAISHMQTFGGLQRAHLELILAYDRTIQGWAKTLELRDIETEGHSKRVTELSDQLGAAMNYSSGEMVNLIRGAMLHDIGKIGIPDSVLLKPDKLNDQEWEQMRRHPIIAYELLFEVDFLKHALDIPRYHHEKWDGSGYPRGLESDLIPQSARIFAVADVWDALRSDRPYRPAWPVDKALAYIKDNRGTHFDPHVVDVFIKEVL
jgi:PAS domain S-box-containing protein